MLEVGAWMPKQAVMVGGPGVPRPLPWVPSSGTDDYMYLVSEFIAWINQNSASFQLINCP